MYALMRCGFQTRVGTVLYVLKSGRQDFVLGFGLGNMGMAALMAAKYLGARQIIAVDVVEDRLVMAMDLGATDVLNLRETPNLVTKIREMTAGGITQELNCTGIARVIEDMTECLRPLGVAATVGVPPSGANISIDPLTSLLQN